MLLDYLREFYVPGEPIFLSDIDLPISNVALRLQLKKLCDSGKICRFDLGIYYLPVQSLLKGSIGLSSAVVAESKYIRRKGRVLGYYSGFTFANQIGLTLQVPCVLEISTNNASANFRKIDIQGLQVVLRKPRISVTAENVRVLQLLDLVSDYARYADDPEDQSLKNCLIAYVKKEGLARSSIKQYLRSYPDRTYKNLIETGVYDDLAA